MNISELINEIISEWSYRVENGMPDATNPTHLIHLGIVLSEMGLSHIKDTLVENLLVEKGKTPQKVAEAEKGNFTNPILNKSIKYKNTKGEDKEGLVGNLLRLPEEHPGRKAAEALLPADGSDERDAINKDLGGEGQPKQPESPKDGEGEPAADGGEEEKAKEAQAMFDPKNDPAMAARMDAEKEVHAKLAKDAEDDKEAEKEQEPKEDGEFQPIDVKDVAQEMPEADPETFSAGSDIPDAIDPKELEQFNTDIKKVAQQVADAKAKGEPTPNINLCDVTVPGTNLYCDDNLGIPRDEMPQFKGNASPGSRAASMDADASGEVDTEPVFREMLQQKGIKTLQTEVPADKLKATQKDLVGAKVVGMMGALEKDPNHPKITAPIYVSRDGFVIDGHHRWAAVVAYNAANPDKQIQMKTTVLDMDIKDAIPMANKFAEDMGIAAKKADANKEAPTSNGAQNISNELKNRKTSEGEQLDVETTPNGSLIIGVEHGEGNESTKEAIKQITSLPKDTKVMFVGEGGMSKDTEGNIEFGGEQDEFRNAVKGHFDNADESSWDENANVYDDNSPVFDVVAKSLGNNKSKSKAAIWSNMVGQGDDMNSDDYLDDDGKEWLIAQAKVGGSGEFDEDVDWNNLTDGQKEDLYQLNFRDDENYGESEISKAQEVYNDFRQNELDRKIKEAEANGYKVIAPVGNSHVDMWRNRNKSKDISSTKKEMTEENLALVDELMLEIIYGFIDEVNVNSEKFKAISKKTQKIVDFDTKTAKDAAVKSGTHSDLKSNKKQTPKVIKLQPSDFRQTSDMKKSAKPIKGQPTKKYPSQTVNKEVEKLNKMDSLVTNSDKETKTRVNILKKNWLKYLNADTKEQKIEVLRELAEYNLIEGHAGGKKIYLSANTTIPYKHLSGTSGTAVTEEMNQLITEAGIDVPLRGGAKDRALADMSGKHNEAGVVFYLFSSNENKNSYNQTQKTFKQLGGDESKFDEINKKAANSIKNLLPKGVKISGAQQVGGVGKTALMKLGIDPKVDPTDLIVTYTNEDGAHAIMKISAKTYTDPSNITMKNAGVTHAGEIYLGNIGKSVDEQVSTLRNKYVWDDSMTEKEKAEQKKGLKQEYLSLFSEKMVELSKTNEGQKQLTKMWKDVHGCGKNVYTQIINKNTSEVEIKSPDYYCTPKPPYEIKYDGVKLIINMGGQDNTFIQIDMKTEDKGSPKLLFRHRTKK